MRRDERTIRAIRRCAAPAAALCVIVLAVGCTLLNQAPVARIQIAPEELSGPSPHTVNFDGAGSSDPDGILVDFEWDFGDGKTATGETAIHTYIVTTETQRFTVTLTVTDDNGATSSTSQSIEVLAGGGGLPGGNGTGNPEAFITVDELVGVAPLTVTFDAVGSTGGEGNIIEYSWDFGDGHIDTGSRVTHEYDPEDEKTRSYWATLRVWNDRGVFGETQVEIIVIVPVEDDNDDDPVAEMEASDPEMIFESETELPALPTPNVPSLFSVEFDPRGSTADAGHQIEYYLWEFGDGEFEVRDSDLQVTHIYELNGETWTYIARLTVFDDQGKQDEVSVNITLSDPYGVIDMEDEE